MTGAVDIHEILDRVAAIERGQDSSLHTLGDISAAINRANLGLPSTTQTVNTVQSHTWLGILGICSTAVAIGACMAMLGMYVALDTRVNGLSDDLTRMQEINNRLDAYNTQVQRRLGVIEAKQETAK